MLDFSYSTKHKIKCLIKSNMACAMRAQGRLKQGRKATTPMEAAEAMDGVVDSLAGDTMSAVLYIINDDIKSKGGKKNSEGASAETSLEDLLKKSNMVGFARDDVAKLDSYDRKILETLLAKMEAKKQAAKQAAKQDEVLPQLQVPRPSHWAQEKQDYIRKHPKNAEEGMADYINPNHPQITPAGKASKTTTASKTSEE